MMEGPAEETCLDVPVGWRQGEHGDGRTNLSTQGSSVILCELRASTGGGAEEEEATMLIGRKAAEGGGGGGGGGWKSDGGSSSSSAGGSLASADGDARRP